MKRKGKAFFSFELFCIYQYVGKSGEKVNTRSLCTEHTSLSCFSSYRNPTSPSDGLRPPTSCMSQGGFPVQPYFVLGGFLPTAAAASSAAAAASASTEEKDPGGGSGGGGSGGGGGQAFPDDPRYWEATAVVLTFIVDNYDSRSQDPVDQEQLRRARAWEEAFVEFMKRWVAVPDNTRHMDVAFNSERYTFCI